MGVTAPGPAGSPTQNSAARDHQQQSPQLQRGRESARTVIIGAGVVGASVAHHLAQLGRTDVIVLDAGPLPRTGGSSSHAPGLVFQTNPSRSMTQLARHTVELWNSLELDGEPCFLPVGGIEVATTPERERELHRRYGFALAAGLDAELLDPIEVGAREPLLDPEQVRLGLHVPTDGVAKSLRAVEAMAREASSRGVEFRGDTMVTGIETADGAVRAVLTDRGRIDCAEVVCCAGIWGPSIGAMVGVTIPVQPLAHQLAWTGPLPELAGARSETEHPILRHQGASLYFRQDHERYAIGSYQHRAIPLRQDEIPTHAQTLGRGGMPTVLPFTPEDFQAPLRDAVRLLPALERAEIADPFNGLFLFTADGMPVIGPSRDVQGFWAAEAVWVTHSGGVGRAVAEWMVEGKPSIDLREADLHRFEPHALSAAYTLARGSQSFREVYDIVHPMQPSEQCRPLRTSPFHRRQEELGAVQLEAAGWERPHWYEANAPLVQELQIPALGIPLAELPERDAWSAQWWSPIIAAEHLAARERVAMVDMTSLATLEVIGPGALAFLQRLTTNQLDRRPGYVTYTLMLDEDGGIRSDLTVARLAPERFQIGSNGPMDLDHLLRRAPDDGSVNIRPTTAETCCIGLWGPRARRVLAALADADVSAEGFGFFRARQMHVGEVPVTALRLSYIGELGWELYTTADMGLRLWDLLWEGGQEHGVLALGRGAFSAMRLEKGYRSWGTDMWAEHTPAQAGLEFAVRRAKGEFLGRAAITAKDGGAAATAPDAPRLTCLVLDQIDQVVLGGEPVLRDGAPIGFVTSAAQGMSIGRSIAYAWMPAASHPGDRVSIGYLDRRYGAEVAEEPLFDPEMTRMRA